MQGIGALAAVVYCFVLSYAILKVLDVVMGVRVEREAEIQGLDLSEHGESGYYL